MGQLRLLTGTSGNSLEDDSVIQGLARALVRTLTGATPFSLVYGMEVVLPFEVEDST